MIGDTHLDIYPGYLSKDGTRKPIALSTKPNMCSPSLSASQKPITLPYLRLLISFSVSYCLSSLIPKTDIRDAISLLSPILLSLALRTLSILPLRGSIPYLFLSLNICTASSLALSPSTITKHASLLFLASPAHTASTKLDDIICLFIMYKYVEC